jgi:hypothetical protein
MKTLLIIYHSLTGGTLQMARAAARGAATEPTVITRLLHATAAQPSDLLAADGYIFATPENLAAMSGLMKEPRRSRRRRAFRVLGLWASDFFGRREQGGLGWFPRLLEILSGGFPNTFRQTPMPR